MSEERDPYSVLGVPRTASVRQIRTAYVARARRSHPDIVGVRGLELMRDINEAWETLKDSARRAAYDTATGGRGETGSAAGRKHHVDGDPNRPFWTGAAGPPPGRAWGHVLDFGIFAGWSLGEISRRDRGYLQWLLDRPEAKGFRAEIMRLLDPDTQDPVEERRRGRR